MAKKRGFAGVVGNVPYGRDYPDDSAEWKRTAEGFRAYAENGMKRKSEYAGDGMNRGSRLTSLVVRRWYSRKYHQKNHF